MRNYIVRMEQEKKDLIGKIKKAVKVIETNPFDMDKTQKMLLAEQIKKMREYLEILNERIKYDTQRG